MKSGLAYTLTPHRGGSKMKEEKKILFKEKIQFIFTPEKTTIYYK